MDMMHGGMGAAFAAWTLLGLALLVLAVVSSVWLIRGMSRHDSGTGGSAVDELERRYARGEIDREEFGRIREDLSAR